MKTGYFIPLFCSLILFNTNDLWAHGVVYEIKETNSITIRVEYDDGEPMSYAEVLIFSPRDEKTAYQNGRTDKRGCFSFLPDCPGLWKIKVDDGMGHGVTEKILIKEDMKTEITHHRFPPWQKLITGISIIWGLTGLLFYLASRRKTRGS